MQTASHDEPTTGRATPSAHTHALVLGSSGAGWTSIEALDPATGLPLWAYEPHRELNAVTGAPSVVFVALSVSHRTDRRQPVSIVALRARDGSRLWWTNTGRVEPRLRWTRLQVGLRIAFGKFSPVGAWQTMRDVRLGGDNTPLVTDGDVLCVCAEKVLFGFDAKSGRLRWVAPALDGQARHVLAVRNGRVLVTGNRDYATGGPGLEALDAHTGRVLWSYSNTPAMPEHPRFARDGEHMYTLVHLASPRKLWRQAIVTLSLADGTPEQQYVLRKPDGVDTVRLISDDGVAYLQRDGSLYAIRLADERELWHTPPFEGLDDHDSWLRLTLSPSVPSGAPRCLMFTYGRSGARSRTLHGALDPRSGAILWQWNESEGPEAHASAAAGVAAVQDAIYVRAADGMHALSVADGRELWRVPHGFPSAREPVLVALDD